MKSAEGYRDLFFQDGEEKVFCYRSGLSVYEEIFEGGMLKSCGRNAAGYPLNVLSNCPTRLDTHRFAEPQAFNLELDGESADMFLDYIGYTREETAEGLLIRVTLKSTVKPLEITVCTLLDGTPVMSRWLEFKNLSDNSMSLNRLCVSAGGFESMREIRKLTDSTDVNGYYSLGYCDYSEWGAEGDFNFRPLTADLTAFGGRFDRERFRQPFFMLKNNLTGSMFFCQLGWSAGYEFSFDYRAHNEFEETDLSVKTAIKSYNPMLVLGAGESFVSPQVHTGYIIGGVDEAVNAMNAHIRKSVLTLPGTASDCLVGSGMGPEHDMSLYTTKRFMEQMADIGCEVFIVDAGWYCPEEAESAWHGRVGDWQTYTARYPDGISEVREYAHSLGMKFGMWVEIERIGKFSEKFKEHPEWRTRHADGENAPEYLDLTNPKAALWAENEAARIIEENMLDLFRVDYNVSSRDYFYIAQQNDKQACASLRHFNAVYKLYENLKKRFPEVVFENCAGGGGRCDLGMLKSFNHTWVSDKQIPPRSLYITNGMTLMLPPEKVDRLVAGMGCHSLGSLDFHMRNAMLGHISMNVFSPAAAEFNTQQLDFVRHSLKVYKEFIRPILSDCLIYHHEPETEKIKNAKTAALEIFSPDGKYGAITVFTLPGFSGEAVTVYPRGTDVSRDYYLTCDNSGARVKVSGYSLMNSGIRVKIPSSLSSELLLLESV